MVTTASPSPAPPRERSSLTILTASDVDAVLTSLAPEDALSSQSDVFLAYSVPSSPSASSTAQRSPSIQVPSRIVLTSDHNTSLFMPSRAASAGGMACKIVSVPSGGGQGGLPGSTIIVDEVTGKVRAVINARKLTAVRNAAGSSLFFKVIAPTRPPKNLVIFGSGGQALSHATFILRLNPSIENCTFVLRRPSQRADELVALLEKTFTSVSFNLGIPPSSEVTADETSTDTFNLSQTVHNANIIVCVTSSTQALFNSVDVTSGTHIILVGSYKPEMREVEDHLIQRAGLVVVDSRKACLAEAGELISSGVKGEGVVELGEVLADGSLVEKIRESGDVVLFKSVGIGIQDVAIAALVLREAESKGLGSIVHNYD